jgi:hypothetical protein
MAPCPACPLPGIWPVRGLLVLGVPEGSLFLLRVEAELSRVVDPISVPTAHTPLLTTLELRAILYS